MFQSDDEITFDADFLSDAFDLASTTSSIECSKRHLEQNEGRPLKKICGNSSQNKDTLSVLSILNSQPKETEKSVQKSPDHRFIRPVLPGKQRRVVVRKFPGPAGILPAQRKLDIDLKKLDNFDSTIRDKNDEFVCSQHSEDVFTRPAWRRMLADLTLPPAASGAPGLVLPERYTIAWTKACATSRQLQGGKIPLLAAAVHQVDSSTRDPMVVLKDRTGEIRATLIREVWDQYGDHIHAGAVLVLRHIGVLSTAKRHYLAITLNNLVTIYADQDELTGGNPPVVTKVNNMSSSDFIKTITDVRNAKNNPFLQTSASRNNINSFGLFTGAECSSKNNLARRDTHSNSSELFTTAECSFTEPPGDNTARSDTQPRSNTHNMNTNSLELFTTAESCSKLPCGDNTARRDTHNRPTITFAAPETSNQSNNFTFKSNFATNRSIVSDTPTFLRSDFDKTIEKSQESEILSQVLDGLDADSIFDDF